MIVRAPRPTERFTTLSNHLIDDDRLSYRALGVLTWILSKPDNWRTDSTTMARGRKEGREAIRVAMRELEAAGYMRRAKVRGDRGRIESVTTVYDDPVPVAAPATKKPSPVTGAQEPGARRADGRYTSDGKRVALVRTENNDYEQSEAVGELGIACVSCQDTQWVETDRGMVRCACAVAS